MVGYLREREISNQNYEKTTNWKVRKYSGHHNSLDTLTDIVTDMTMIRSISNLINTNKTMNFIKLQVAEQKIYNERLINIKTQKH